MKTTPFRLGMAQIRVEGGRPRENLERAEHAIARGAAEGCRLIVLPECLDLGWTDPSARELAQPIPGERSDFLASVAKQHATYVATGLVERAGDRLYNAAVLIDPCGELRLHYRKINELDIGLELYSVGDRLAVVDTELGTIGLNICADNFGDSLALGHVLARMGAQLIVSPSAWAVDATHDNTAEPYGKLWRDSYAQLTDLYAVTVVGVSNVGWITGGPWQGRKCIGCSLAMGPGGTILAQAPYGDQAETVICVEVHPRPPEALGTNLAPCLKARGYHGP